jgi:hypothetical protein
MKIALIAVALAFASAASPVMAENFENPHAINTPGMR